MAKRILVLIGIICSIHLDAQTEIGTNAPNASAIFDINSSTATTTAPTKGVTSIDYVKYRIMGGKEFEVEYNYLQTGAAGYGALTLRLASSFGDLIHISAQNSATVIPYDATKFRIHTNNWGTVGWAFYRDSLYQLNLDSAGFKMTFRFKAL